MTHDIIKIENYLLVVDDSEIKEGDWCYDIALGIFQASHNCNAYNTDLCKKITYSTHPMQGVFPIPITEVKELLGEVDVEKKAEREREKLGYTNKFITGFVSGYNQALEDNKDKKFTEEHLRKAMRFGSMRNKLTISELESSFQQLKQSLQPKTEWEVEYDENGKLKLV